jgi:dihydrofolate synthase / folylpolyglutamate synthase
MRFDSLPEWLIWQEKLHFTAVDPGLERVGKVWERLNSLEKLPFTVITVAGTNGKGSSVAMLESILRAAGYRIGTYTSPHLLHYNERICINNLSCSDDEICQSFSRIDNVRGDISLTYFEFATLAAIDIFCQQDLDVVILEVGMGGRLDAVNLFDADIALITPISLDHTNWLGNDIEKIAAEKAGILRASQSVVCSESLPAKSVKDRADALNTSCYIAEQDFFVERRQQDWDWCNDQFNWLNLPLPALLGHYQTQNAAAVLAIIALLNDSEFNIDISAIKTGLQTVKLAGRFQVIDGEIERIFDVTHNHQGACNLAELLAEKNTSGQTRAVLAMLKDKDVSAVIEPLKTTIDQWYIAGLDGSRGLSSDDLTNKIKAIVGEDKTFSHALVEEAYQHAMLESKPDDRVLIFGSFHTVEAVMRLIPEYFSKEENDE